MNYSNKIKEVFEILECETTESRLFFNKLLKNHENDIKIVCHEDDKEWLAEEGNYNIDNINFVNDNEIIQIENEIKNQKIINKLDEQYMLYIVTDKLIKSVGAIGYPIYVIYN